MPEPVTLTAEECRALLAGNVVGRVGFDAGSGPRIHPVNYAVDGDSVVVRTSEQSELGSLARTSGSDTSSVVAFEIDHVDYERHQGWSVLVVGEVSVVDDDRVAQIVRGWAPRPWAAGDRSLFVRVTWREVSGRRLGDDLSTPVRRTL